MNLRVFPAHVDGARGRFGIRTRRCFYSLISSFPMYHGLPSAAPAPLPHAVRAADQVLCLPSFPDMNEVDRQRVVDSICQLA
jgi:dTDP-4-amino-4,6-dideoxygalactose transaminase